MMNQEVYISSLKKMGFNAFLETDKISVFLEGKATGIRVVINPDKVIAFDIKIGYIRFDLLFSLFSLLPALLSVFTLVGFSTFPTNSLVSIYFFLLTNIIVFIYLRININSQARLCIEAVQNIKRQFEIVT